MSRLLPAFLLASVPLFGQKEDWLDLFNGKNLDGWIVKIAGHELGDNYGDIWSIPSRGAIR